jgi:hypothetical protein
MHHDLLPGTCVGGYGAKLLKAFEQWCENRKVVDMSLGVNSGETFEAVARFVTRMGCSKVDEKFVRQMVHSEHQRIGINSLEVPGA